MRFHALACDYDGTLAHDGHMDQATTDALDRLRKSGRSLLLVTGRELDELLAILPNAGIFDWIVAENGALLYCPGTREEKLLGPRPPAEFVDRLRKLDVKPLSVGRAIVATRSPHEGVVIKTIRELGLELQVIFNKGAVMILPAGVNKATGLLAALKVMGLSLHEIVGIGDAENDHAFLSQCECGVAVANALQAVKDRVDLVTQGHHGGGAVELIDRITANDLGDLPLHRHDLVIGVDRNNVEIRLPAYGPNVLIAEAAGRSSVACSLIERLMERHYQFCVVDPRGAYVGVPGTVALGTAERRPTVADVLEVMKSRSANIVLDLAGLPADECEAFVRDVLRELQEMRAKMGRPHWLVIGDAHRFAASLPKEMNRTILVTTQVEKLGSESVGTVIAVGADAEKWIARFCEGVGEKAPAHVPSATAAEDVLYWARAQKSLPTRIGIAPAAHASE